MSGQRTINVPLWYQQERQTQKTIMRLTCLKELEFYISNPDEYIRHQAIFRLGQLKLKESAGLLMKVVDDPLEIRINRELAAWVLKSTGLAGNSSYFIENQYLGKFSGDERLKDFYNPSFNDHCKELNYRFGESGIQSLLMDESIFMKADSVEKMPELPFSFREWFVSYIKGIRMQKKIKSLFQKPFAHKKEKKPDTSISDVFQVKTPGEEESPSETPIISIAEQIHPVQNKVKRKRPETYKRKSTIYVHPHSGNTSFGSFIHNFFRRIFRILLFPFAVLWNQKVVITIVLVCLYLFFTFIPFGRMLFYKKSPDLARFNDHLVQTAGLWIEEKVSSIREKSSEYQLVRDIHKQLAAAQTKEEAGTGHIKYIVTAQKLNLRKEPGPSGEKLLLLTESTVVEYLNRSSQQDDGIWFNIMAPDGTVGWSLSTWLKKIEIGIEAYEGK